MIRHIRYCAVALWLAGSLAAAPPPAQATQQAPARQQAPAPGRVSEQRVDTAQVVVEDADAGQTREQFQRLLERYPPGVGRVLKLDPSLMTNGSYLATYPALQDFLARNPSVAHNPAYFLENVNIGEGYRDSRSASERMWNEIMSGVAALTVLIVVTGTLVWLVQTVIDYRRWNRLSRIQTEVHTKILDRFGSNEELLRYMQTPAGQRFLESAPIPLEAEPRRIGAPFSRILWSVQAGAVLAIVGFGLMFVSTRVVEDVSHGVFAAGVLALSLGMGFALSAVISFMISRRLGLFTPPSAPATSDHA
jgi:hypothetical protein